MASDERIGAHIDAVTAEADSKVTISEWRVVARCVVEIARTISNPARAYGPHAFDETLRMAYAEHDPGEPIVVDGGAVPVVIRSSRAGRRPLAECKRCGAIVRARSKGPDDGE